MLCRGRNKLAVNVWQSKGTLPTPAPPHFFPSPQVLKCVCVHLLECVSWGLCFVLVCGYQFFVWVRLTLVTSGPKRIWVDSRWCVYVYVHVSVSVCVHVHVSVEQSRGRSLVGSLLEEDALPFLHPRVVLHQLRVQKGVLWDAVLYPLHQAFFLAVGERHRWDTFFRFQWQIFNQGPSLVFPYKAR